VENFAEGDDGQEEALSTLANNVATVYIVATISSIRGNENNDFGKGYG
jgi:hypothetical protein